MADAVEGGKKEHDQDKAYAGSRQTESFDPAVSSLAVGLTKDGETAAAEQRKWSAATMPTPAGQKAPGPGRPASQGPEPIGCGEAPRLMPMYKSMKPFRRRRCCFEQLASSEAIWIEQSRAQDHGDQPHRRGAFNAGGMRRLGARRGQQRSWSGPGRETADHRAIRASRGRRPAPREGA